jgi:hypothetical protein
MFIHVIPSLKNGTETKGSLREPDCTWLDDIDQAMHPAVPVSRLNRGLILLVDAFAVADDTGSTVVKAHLSIVKNMTGPVEMTAGETARSCKITVQ